MENKAVIINKFDSIQKCIKRIEEEYENNPENLKDYRKMDGIVLNLRRACETVCYCKSKIRGTSNQKRSI